MLRDPVGEDLPALRHRAREDERALAHDRDLGRGAPYVEDEDRPLERLVAEEPEGVAHGHRPRARRAGLEVRRREGVHPLGDALVLRHGDEDERARVLGRAHDPVVGGEGRARLLLDVRDVVAHDEREPPRGHGREVGVADDRVLARDADVAPLGVQAPGEEARREGTRDLDRVLGVHALVAELVERDADDPLEGERGALLADRDGRRARSPDVDPEGAGHQSSSGGMAASRSFASLTEGSSAGKFAITYS